MKLADIQAWLMETDPVRLEALWAQADQVRRDYVGDAVHLRGLIEISNYCIHACLYCGLRSAQLGVTRYRMSAEEILLAAGDAVKLGYGTVVLQAGDDPAITTAWMADVITALKTSYPDLAVTLSLGEREPKELECWHRAGADRYLLRFETSDPFLYAYIHPSHPKHPRPHRLEQLLPLRDIGYELGSGVMVGIPGQSWSSLARDIALFKELDLDMIGLGPFIATPGTPLANKRGAISDPVPNDTLTTYKALALARLMRPDANIPATTALGTLDPQHGRLLGLQRGANVVMPNITPAHLRENYTIYPGKANVSETADYALTRKSSGLTQQLAKIGRTIGQGQGSRNAYCRYRSRN